MLQREAIFRTTNVLGSVLDRIPAQHSQSESQFYSGPKQSFTNEEQSHGGLAWMGLGGLEKDTDIAVLAEHHIDCRIR